MKTLISLDIRTVNPRAYMEAVRRLHKLFPYKSEKWFERSKERLFNVKYLGAEKKRFIKHLFYVKKDRKDNPDAKFKGYKVVISGRKFWCQCFFTHYGERRILDPCTHVGACFLFLFYLEALRNGFI